MQIQGQPIGQSDYTAHLGSYIIDRTTFWRGLRHLQTEETVWFTVFCGWEKKFGKYFPWCGVFIGGGGVRGGRQLWSSSHARLECRVNGNFRLLKNYRKAYFCHSFLWRKSFKLNWRQGMKTIYAEIGFLIIYSNTGWGICIVDCKYCIYRYCIYKRYYLFRLGNFSSKHYRTFFCCFTHSDSVRMTTLKISFRTFYYIYPL